MGRRLSYGIDVKSQLEARLRPFSEGPSCMSALFTPLFAAPLLMSEVFTTTLFLPDKLNKYLYFSRR